MKRIKKFLCTADPLLSTMGLMLAALIIAEMFLMGFGVVLIMFGLGCVACAVSIAIGWVIYKTIVFAQEKCCDRTD